MLRKRRRAIQAKAMASRVQMRNDMLQKKLIMSSDFEATTEAEIGDLKNERVYWLCCCSDFDGHVVMLLISALVVGVSVSIIKALIAAYTISAGTYVTLIVLSTILSAGFLCNLCGLCALWGFTVTRRQGPRELCTSAMTLSKDLLSYIKM
jgi:hypothetical protein